jgi:proteasome lid subunit RPN8/RPN11
MVSLLPTLWRALRGSAPNLVCDGRTWNAGVDELRRRAGRRRESGAFLLGHVNGGIRRVREFLFYDDVDPACFVNGIVEFDGARFGRVWEHCRTRAMTVVADVHVHPGHFAQSHSDRHNPMIPEVGHLALIIPNYAAGKRLPGDIGVYEYRGSREWLDHSSRGRRVFLVGWWPK